MIEDRIAQWPRPPDEGVPDSRTHMSDTYVLRDAGNVAFLARPGLSTKRQSLPDCDPNILREILDRAGVAFINGRDATHHGGVGFDDLPPNSTIACSQPAFISAFVLNIADDHGGILQTYKVAARCLV